PRVLHAHQGAAVRRGLHGSLGAGSEVARGARAGAARTNRHDPVQGSVRPGGAADAGGRGSVRSTRDVPGRGGRDRKLGGGAGGLDAEDGDRVLRGGARTTSKSCGDHSNAAGVPSALTAKLVPPPTIAPVFESKSSH